MKMSIAEKLSAFRAELKTHNLAGFIIPHDDEYQSEYLPACAERLAWLTGFTGSAGYAVILQDCALAMTYGLYATQIKREVDQSLYEIGDFREQSMGKWIADHSKPEDVIGYHPAFWTRSLIEKIEADMKGKNISLMPVDWNPVDVLWADQPEPPLGQVEIFPDDIAGASSREKRQTLAQNLAAQKIAAVVITECDSICWLLNVRGDDIPFNPLVLSRLVLFDDATVNWYVDHRKIPDEVRAALGSEIRIHAPQDFETDLAGLTGVVEIDPDRSPMSAGLVLKQHGIQTVDGKNPCVKPKSIKTPAEQKAIKQAHIRDGVAVTQFLRWLDCQDFANVTLTELEIVDKLEEFRKGQDGYRGKSFFTIASWADHGPIIHMRPTPETNQAITGNNFLLVDSGGQYEYGTTDITRTIVIGDITDDMKRHFTYVMKAYIAVNSAVFDDTVEGYQLDELGRSVLKQQGMDFPHGTGHGVGCMLAVHEEAPYISPNSKGQTYHAGMLLSNEPGFYLGDAYGIRHENLMMCQERDDGKLYWETITLVPFDLRGIEWSLMTEQEVGWLKDYHSRVFETLKPFLSSEEIDWLEHYCFSYFK